MTSTAIFKSPCGTVLRNANNYHEQKLSGEIIYLHAMYPVVYDRMPAKLPQCGTVKNPAASQQKPDAPAEEAEHTQYLNHSKCADESVWAPTGDAKFDMLENSGSVVRGPLARHRTIGPRHVAQPRLGRFDLQPDRPVTGQRQLNVPARSLVRGLETYRQ